MEQQFVCTVWEFQFRAFEISDGHKFIRWANKICRECSIRASLSGMAASLIYIPQCLLLAQSRHPHKITACTLYLTTHIGLPDTGSGCISVSTLNTVLSNHVFITSSGVPCAITCPFAMTTR